MIKEVQQLQQKGAWQLVHRPRDAKVLPGLWQYKIKRDENGNVAKCKARWCVDGSRSPLDTQPESKFSPVAEKTTIRMLFAIAAHGGHEVKQADFPNAYLNAEITEDVYVAQPKGMEDPMHRHKVCKLNKALYGMPMSGKCWHDALSSCITSQLGYHRSKIDHCLFYRPSTEGTSIMAVYVDDILCMDTGGGNRALQHLQELQRIWELKILGQAAHVLGMRIQQTENAIYLDQTAFIQEILLETGDAVGHPVVNPWDGKTVHETGECLKKKQHESYRNKLGKLLYLAGGTRPDIAFAVSRLAAAAESPRQADWSRLLRVIRYLKGTKYYCIRYLRANRNDQLDLHGFVDSSFGVNPTNGKSVTGMVIKVAGGPVEWRSHLQETTADSTNAAEYIALWEGAKAILGVANIIQELQLKTSLPILYEDNLGALRLATAGMGQARARHLTCKYHAVQDWTGTKRLKIDYVPTTKQLADILTKGGHSASTLEKLTAGMGIVTAAPQGTIVSTSQGVGPQETSHEHANKQDQSRQYIVSPVGEMQTNDKTATYQCTEEEHPNEERRFEDRDVDPPR